METNTDYEVNTLFKYDNKDYSIKARHCKEANSLEISLFDDS